MKNPKQNAARWIKEAEYTFYQAERTLKDNAYNLACFLAEQTSQKALKAVLYLGGARFITTHSIKELVKEISKKHPEFTELADKGALLDQYYLSSRYPDAVPEPAIPSEIFIKKQAEEAVDIAREIFELCKKMIGL